MALLRLEGVGKSFGAQPIVDDLTLEVADGELFVLVGPSGCGKTTTLRMIAGLEHPDAGTITIGERDITSLPPGSRDVAMVFQSFALFPHMTVFDNIAFGMNVRGDPRHEIGDRVMAAADRLGLRELLQRKPRELSGGERQRVSLGRILVRNPSVVLMDEPLSNLDAPLRAQMRGEIGSLQERLGTTTVYVTHDQTEALAMGHRLGVMDAGRLQQIGEPRAVYDAPATMFVARFIGSPAMNFIDATLDGGSLDWAAGTATVAARGRPGRVIAGVRSEHVHVAGSRWSGERASDAFPARIDRVEPLGDQTIVTLDASGVRLFARVEPSFPGDRGDRVDAWLDPRRVHLFDPTTEERL